MYIISIQGDDQLLSQRCLGVRMYSRAYLCSSIFPAQSDSNGLAIIQLDSSAFHAELSFLQQTLAIAA